MICSLRDMSISPNVMMTVENLILVNDRTLEIFEGIYILMIYCAKNQSRTIDQEVPKMQQNVLT